MNYVTRHIQVYFNLLFVILFLKSANAVRGSLPVNYWPNTTIFNLDPYYNLDCVTE